MLTQPDPEILKSGVSRPTTQSNLIQVQTETEIENIHKDKDKHKVKELASLHSEHRHNLALDCSAGSLPARNSSSTPLVRTERHRDSS